MRSVAYAYNDVLLSLAKIDIAIANMDFNRKMLDETTLKFEAGASTLSDVLNFKIQFNNAESSLNSAEHTLGVSKFALAYLMGLTEGNIPSTVSFPNMPSPDGIMLSDVNVYLDLALQNRPDLKKMRETLESNKYGFYSSIAAFGPTVSWDTKLNYSNSFNSERSRYGNYASDKYRKSVGSMSNALTVSWEIFSGGRTYFNMRATEASMKTVEYDLADTWLTVVNEVRTAYDNYLTALKQVKLYQKNLELVRKTRDLVEQEYNAGSTAITRLNEVQRDLVDSESSLATAVINLHNAKAQLDTSISAD